MNLWKHHIRSWFSTEIQKPIYGLARNFHGDCFSVWKIQLLDIHFTYEFPAFESCVAVVEHRKGA